MGNAFFYAPTEEEARKKIASWQHFTRHNEVLVESLETAPHGFQFQWRPGLPATQTIDEQEQA